MSVTKYRLRRLCSTQCSLYEPYITISKIALHSSSKAKRRKGENQKIFGLGPFTISLFYTNALDLRPLFLGVGVSTLGFCRRWAADSFIGLTWSRFSPSLLVLGARHTMESMHDTPDAPFSWGRFGFEFHTGLITWRVCSLIWTHPLPTTRTQRNG